MPGLRFGVFAAVVASVLTAGGVGFRSAEARANYERAVRYADRGLWSPALLAFNQALRLEPEHGIGDGGGLCLQPEERRHEGLGADRGGRPPEGVWGRPRRLGMAPFQDRARPFQGDSSAPRPPGNERAALNPRASPPP